MKKMIVRADDVGYTHVFNIGTFESIDNGIVTSADVMLESPGTVEALEFLRERPWLSIGWHSHFWFSPVLPVEQVQSCSSPAPTGSARTSAPPMKSTPESWRRSATPR